jgi:hypothetical protein
MNQWQVGLRRTAEGGTPSESRPTTQVRGHCQVWRTNPGVLWYHSPATLGSRLRFRETVLYSNPRVIPASDTIPPLNPDRTATATENVNWSAWE